MKCRVCGSDNLQDAKYCINCGSLLENNEFRNAVTNEFTQKNEKSGLATASMIFGIISTIMGVICCFGWASIIISILFGTLAIVFAIMAWNAGSRGQVVAGLVLGIIGLMLGSTLLTIELTADLWSDWVQDNYPDIWDEFNNNL